MLSVADALPLMEYPHSQNGDGVEEVQKMAAFVLSICPLPLAQT